jgi:hypothetical protein
MCVAIVCHDEKQLARVGDRQESGDAKSCCLPAYNTPSSSLRNAAIEESSSRVDRRGRLSDSKTRVRPG